MFKELARALCARYSGEIELIMVLIKGSTTQLSDLSQTILSYN